MEDPLLHKLDRWLFFGHEPATVLHTVFGETWAAHFFAFIYLLYLPLAPLSLVVWLVWSRNISYGYWYATANCLTWTLGHDQLLPDPDDGAELLVPLALPGLEVTGVTDLQDSLWNGRQDVRFPLNPFSDSIQSVAGFASLHIALTLVIALVAHYTVRHAADPLGGLGLLRAHGDLDALLRLALRRRRHRRRGHRGARGVAGGHRHRAEVRARRARRPDHEHGRGARDEDDRTRALRADPGTTLSAPPRR